MSDALAETPAGRGEDRAGPMRIAICVATRRRPRGLARLLASIDVLEVPRDCEVSVLVVENDAAHDGPVPACAMRIRRVFEPTAGIPQARNRALAEAADSCDRILFVDDDETVERDLLVRLLDAERAAGGDVAVTGPALPAFPTDAPSWAARSGAYMPPRHAHGSMRPYAFTNNTMFPAEWVRGGRARFDESMRFTGGSDRAFFAALVAQGRRIVWADDAVTHEWYPRERLTARWLFQRSMRLGTVARRTEQLRGVRGTVAILWRAARFAVRAAWRALRNLHDPPVALALASWDVGRSAGLVLAAIGLRYDEYGSR
jgi:succinoglycan biosynthesis protein ExoM